MSKLFREPALSGETFELKVARTQQSNRLAEQFGFSEDQIAEARREGVLVGRAEASQEVESYLRGLDANLQNTLDALGDAARDLQVRRDQLLENLSKPILGLAGEISHAMVGYEVKNHPEKMEELLMELVGDLKKAADVTVRLAPDSLDVVEERKCHLPDNLSFEADPTLLVGEVTIDSELGGWDARFRERWSRIQSVLTSQREDFLEEAPDESDPEVNDEGEAA